MKSSKIVPWYDADNDKFGSASIVLKMGSTLKQCCDIAEFNILKEIKHSDLDDTQRRLKNHLLAWDQLLKNGDHMKFLLTHARKYSKKKKKKWNKPAYFPLTSDIICIQNKCIKELKENPNNVKAYRVLQET